jgi:Protein of unknown function (DUF1285)
VSVPAPAPGIPPGTFRIDRDGAWRHEGQEVTHPGVLRNLYANLRVDERGHYLQVGPMRVDVEAADAPFVVTRAEVPSDRTVGPSSLRVHLTDGTHEELDPAGVWLGRADAPYCRVKAGRFLARFSVAAWLQLADRLEEEPGSDRPLLVVGDRRIPLERRR